MSLDTENKNIGYLLGRLFAVFEKTQQVAAAGQETRPPLEDLFAKAAVTTPDVTFTKLFRLNVEQQNKISDPERAEHYKQLVASIVDQMPSEPLPKILSLDDQNQFWIGKSHQETFLLKNKFVPEKVKNEPS